MGAPYSLSLSFSLCSLSLLPFTSDPLSVLPNPTLVTVSSFRLGNAFSKPLAAQPCTSFEAKPGPIPSVP